MNKRRLLKMADLLQADAKNRKGICFDFGLWGEIEDEKEPMSCDTRACALGLAAISGAFKRAGLGYTEGAKAEREVAKRIRKFVASGGEIPYDY